MKNKLITTLKLLRSYLENNLSSNISYFLRPPQVTDITHHVKYVMSLVTMAYIMVEVVGVEFRVVLPESPVYRTIFPGARRRIDGFMPFESSISSKRTGMPWL